MFELRSGKYVELFRRNLPLESKARVLDVRLLIIDNTYVSLVMASTVILAVYHNLNGQIEIARFVSEDTVSAYYVGSVEENQVVLVEQVNMRILIFRIVDGQLEAQRITRPRIKDLKIRPSSSSARST